MFYDGTKAVHAAPEVPTFQFTTEPIAFDTIDESHQMVLLQ